MNKGELRRFKKAELMDLARETDFGFKPRSKMTKVELVEAIFRSPNFKVMKANLKPKDKKELSEKRLEALKRGREKRKENALVVAGNPNANKRDAKELSIVESKEERASRINVNQNELRVADRSNNLIDTQQVKNSTHKALVENELVPYESVREENNNRYNQYRDMKILERGAKAVKNLSGENITVVSQKTVNKQKANLAANPEKLKVYEADVQAALSQMADQKFAGLLLNIFKADREEIEREKEEKAKLALANNNKNAPKFDEAAKNAIQEKDKVDGQLPDSELPAISSNVEKSFAEGKLVVAPEGGDIVIPPDMVNERLDIDGEDKRVDNVKEEQKEDMLEEENDDVGQEPTSILGANVIPPQEIDNIIAKHLRTKEYQRQYQADYRKGIRRRPTLNSGDDNIINEMAEDTDVEGLTSVTTYSDPAYLASASNNVELARQNASVYGVGGVERASQKLANAEVGANTISESIDGTSAKTLAIQRNLRLDQ